ncbi:DUF2179 domain-containing protein [Patescibacteria group bacterium]|nr:DUF2179 domain-containing protein [Patescibacteria group bacterium]
MTDFFDSNTFAIIVLPLLIFLARVIDVSMATIRIIFISKGMKMVSAILGFFEVLIWVIAISQVMQNLDNWVNYIAYAAGFAAGTYIGIIIENKIAIGTLLLQVITKKEAKSLIKELRNNNHRITSVCAEGNDGKVHILYIVTKRKKYEEVVFTIRNHNPRAFFSVESIKVVQDSFLGSGKADLQMASQQNIHLQGKKVKRK